MYFSDAAEENAMSARESRLTCLIFPCNSNAIVPPAFVPCDVQHSTSACDSIVVTSPVFGPNGAVPSAQGEALGCGDT